MGPVQLYGTERSEPMILMVSDFDWCISEYDRRLSSSNVKNFEYRGRGVIFNSNREGADWKRIFLLRDSARYSFGISISTSLLLRSTVFSTLARREYTRGKCIDSEKGGSSRSHQRNGQLQFILRVSDDRTLFVKILIDVVGSSDVEEGEDEEG